MNERVSSAKACADLVRRSLTRFELPYITITPTFSICPKHGYLAGEHHHCPTCDDEAKTAGTFDQVRRQPCEVWTRVMGYHRPVSAFNPGKQSEHFERQHFLEDKARNVAA